LKSFWKCYEQLPAHIQKLAEKNFALFKANPRHPSLGFRKKGQVYTVEIGRRYRALARERNGHYYWFWIGYHLSSISYRLFSLPNHFFKLRAEHIHPPLTKSRPSAMPATS
jgi:hypothetical protein